VADQTLWESFVSNQHLAPFLQSWYWGDFQKQQGRQVHRIAYLRGGAAVAAALGIITQTRFGTVFYVPYGPVLDWSDQVLAETFLQHLVAVARDSGADYLRIDPRVETSPATRARLEESGFRRAPTFVQAEFDLVLDIGSSTEQQLLSGLRKTTRNLVRKATSIGVKIEVTENTDRFDAFQSLLDATAQRHNIVFQGRDYLRAQFEVLSGAGIASLFIASHEDRPMAAAVIVFYGDNASYVHGASLAQSDVPASHLLQWAAMQEAQRRQFKYYSFWGIAPNEDPKHPLHGVSLFKKGFGGTSVTYVGAWDYSLRPRYWLVWLVETVRRRVRRI
jgi:lipid II:glycine glycyltransferase (peptidoglycan interpeptide bridge formation enzyme)